MNAELPFRPNVCMLVFNRDKKLFLGERFNNPGVWQFPQGGVEQDLSIEKNVLREVNEELGIKINLLKIISKLSATHKYIFEKAPDYAKDVWQGQDQTFWLVEFLGRDSEINLNSGAHAQEFQNWKWCTVSEVRKFAEKKRLHGYEPALKEFEAFCNNIERL